MNIAGFLVGMGLMSIAIGVLIGKFVGQEVGLAFMFGIFGMAVLVASMASFPSGDDEDDGPEF